MWSFGIFQGELRKKHGKANYDITEKVKNEKNSLKIEKNAKHKVFFFSKNYLIHEILILAYNSLDYRIIYFFVKIGFS